MPKFNVLQSYQIRLLRHVFLGFALLMSFSPIAQSRERVMLDKAVENSDRERSQVETRYKEESKLSRKLESTEMRAIDVEIGDELGADDSGAESSGGVGANKKDLSVDRTFVDASESKSLDREWKAVNRSLKDSDKTESKREKSGRLNSSQARLGGGETSKISGGGRGATSRSSSRGKGTLVGTDENN